MTVFISKIAPYPTYDDLRSVIKQLHDSSEKRNIGLHRSLHDELGGLIVSVAMDLSAAAQHLELTHLAQQRLRRAQKSVMAAVDLNRSLSEDLRPSLLDNLGLFAALRWHIKNGCAQSPVVCSEHYPDEEIPFTPQATTALYRIARESLALMFSEPELKSVEVDVKVERDVFQMTLTHEHLGDEPVDLFDDRPDVMHSLAERTRSLTGEMLVGHSRDGTALIHRFALEQLVRAGSGQFEP